MSWWRRLFGIQTADNQRPQDYPAVNAGEPKRCQLTPRLEATVPEGWSQHPSPNPDTVLLVRDKSKPSGRLEISHGELEISYTGVGQPLLPTPADLEEQACEIGSKIGGGRVVRKSSGSSAIGSWGSAVVHGGTAYTGRGFERANVAHIQQWYLINRENNLLNVLTVGHVCFEAPCAEEVAEAEEIVLGLAIRNETAPTKPQAHLTGMRWQQAERAKPCRTLPEPSEGYSWELAGQSQASFLRPQNWHFKAWEKEGELAYFITQEPIPANAKPGSFQFETGFTINVWRKASLLKGLSPSTFAAEYVQAVAQSGEFCRSLYS